MSEHSILDVLRTEQKYALAPTEAAHLDHVLRAALHADRHSGTHGYTVRSLYFDTPDNADFREKVDGLEQRRKIRLRIYAPDAPTAKLELKEKQGALQRKRSLVLDREAAQRLCAGEYGVLLETDTPFALELYGRMSQFCYRPKCVVEYDRRAFTAAANDTRVTLDSGLRASESRLDLFAPDLVLYPAGPLGLTTLEVKFSGFLLRYVKDAVSLSRRTQLSLSKYCAARSATLRADP